MTPEAEVIDAVTELAALLESDAPLREDWVTINGVHVFIGADGNILKGPKGMIGKPPPGKSRI